MLIHLPNPVEDALMINWPTNGAVQYRLTEVNGRAVLNTSLSSAQTGSYVLDTRNLDQGVYILLLNDGASEHVLRFVK